MSASTLHPLARDYLETLRQAGRELPSARLHELLTEIEGHLSEAIPPDASEQEALEVLDRLGAPGDIVEAEQPAALSPADRRSWREWTAVFLLPLGGFLFGIGWFVGLILLWSSRLWTTRDKLIGTLIFPGGIVGGLYLLIGLGTTRHSEFCSGFADQINPSTGAVIRHGTMHCTRSAGTSTLSNVLGIALLIVVVLGPIASAVYLARRAR